MKILKVIHGYPMRYNAGSEVYSQTLCQALAGRHEVNVFTREEDAFSPDFRLRTENDMDDPRIAVHLVNNPRFKDRYRAAGIDQRFAEVLDRFGPDVVHVGHLNHLSTSLLCEAALRQVPIVFTLHDYWLMCPRGQFMQMFPENPDNLWAACDGQEDRKCAERCYARYFSGGSDEFQFDVGYWTNWVAQRMQHIRKMTELVDMFIAPARYLHDRFRDEFGLPPHKLVYLDYGFARQRMAGRCRVAGEPFTFGYIGTHIPAKGIQDLILAFGLLRGNARLRIWGRSRGQDTEALKAIVKTLPPAAGSRVEWFPEYRNQAIVTDVFDRCDAIVVPSIWFENSPLVIHEAQQARVPVITANVGGMAEYVRHEVNGLLFEHRSITKLVEQMQRLVDNPKFASQLGARGYLYSDSGDIPSVEQHVRDVEAIYERVLHRRASTRLHQRSGPWRITFDTNPDTCNLNCIMCEEHSHYSPLLKHRKQEKQRHRLMPLEMIERIIAESAPHGLREIIPSTMGEPLLYKDFGGILRLCHRYGVKLNLTTNGTFPGLKAKGWAEQIVPVASDVKISWNGATQKTYEAIMQGYRWEDALKNVRDFIAVRDKYAETGRYRCRVTFQLTFLEKNVAELADMVRLAIDLGVDRVKGHHLWEHFEEIRGQSMRRNPDAIKRWNRAVLDARRAATERPLSNGKHVLLENFFLLDAQATEDLAPGGSCPFLGQEAWISTTGRFNPCCAPNAQRQTLGEFGNLNEKSLMELWNGNDYRQFVSTYQNCSVCRSCNMRKPLGDGA
jgi:glycosyltransferase involved in cell wall biosynthesis/MoaA/NifB/PqqE/SkfB family radical SAM enzyme